MGIFDNVNDAQDVTQEEDRVRGQKQGPLASGIYDAVIKHIYAKKSASGALSMNVALTIGDREVRITEWVASSDEKKNKTYYEREEKDSNGNVTGISKRHLPGYTLINDLALLTCNKGLMEVANEEKELMLYDRDAGKEVPTKVPVLTEFTGKATKVCLLHTVEDRTKKDDNTGKYVPTGETFARNTADKFLHTDNRTVSEIKNKLDNADYSEKWLGRWENQVNDVSTGVQTGGTAGTPQTTAGTSGAPKSGLFD